MIDVKENVHPGRMQAERLIPLLRQQVTLYLQLLQLSRQQRELITREDPQPLLSLLAERQQVVEALGRAQAEMAPLQQYWRMNFGMIPPEVRREAEGLLQKISEALKGILEADETDSRLLAARKVQTTREVTTVTVSQQAHRAYGPTRLVNAGYLRTDESA
ncbi:MAG: hypothetical protein HJJLKODD_01818 [Phycisphaerae bacterium]|nr:hypothetical protein [Phycisphaerae bacterium]